MEAPELTTYERRVRRVLLLLLAATGLALACGLPWRAFNTGWLARPEALPGPARLAVWLAAALRAYPYVALVTVFAGWLALAFKRYRLALACAWLYLVYAGAALALLVAYTIGLSFSF
ncbi:MAG: hypothetical protein HYZ26_07325 [Chloroflexi bacterium]|nr:hypothetical protein [Chloroflexota bacterium]